MTVRSSVILGLVPLALVACTDGAVSTASTGASDGVARQLNPGMTAAEAEATLGMDAGFERNPANWDQSCISYAYESAEGPRYVHAVFENETLVRATDGHGDICTYADPV